MVRGQEPLQCKGGTQQEIPKRNQLGAESCSATRGIVLADSIAVHLHGCTAQELNPYLAQYA
eukprot:4814289-Lingulodinium_polyedra.AAC.1